MSTRNTPRIGAAVALLLSLSVMAYAQPAPDDVWSVDAGSGVRAVAFSPDGSLVASGSTVSVGSPMSEAVLWNASDGAFVQQFPGHEDDFFSLAFSPDGAYLAAGAIAIAGGYPVPGGVTDLWNLATGELVDTFSGCWTGFSADGTRLMSAGGGVIRYVNVYRVSDGVRIADIYTGDYLTAAAFAPSGELAASGDYDGNVEIWNVDSETLVHGLTHSADPVRTLAFSPDGSLLASGGQSNDVKLWDVATGDLVQTLDHGGSVTSVAFSAAGDTLISTGTTDGIGRSIRFWDVAGGDLLSTLQPGTPLPYSAAFSPEGSDFVYGLSDGTMALAVSPVAPALPGDYNDDGAVDLLDYDVFYDCMAGVGVVPDPVETDAPSCLSVFDFDGDSDVDAADFVGFQAAFTN
jgi:WD40 repeat protein